MDKGLVDEIVKGAAAQKVINSVDFFFQRAQDALMKWLEMIIPDSLKSQLLSLSKDYEKIQSEANTNAQLKQVLDLLFEIISFCDTKAKDKNIINTYADKRCLANASVRMNYWVNHLILYKLSKADLKDGSTKNAFEYLIDPDNQATILSKNHRELIAKNLIGKEYEPANFIVDLKSFFAPYQFNTVNPKNYTHLLSMIIYGIEGEWKEEVVALMASDGTGWQDEHIKALDTKDASLVWNTKRPTGRGETLRFLKNIIEDGGTFNLYYCSAGKVNYKASILDFVENQQELDSKNWQQQFNKIYNYEQDFAAYTSEGKKASIVFLTKELVKIDPLPVSDFQFYGDYQAPRQDNLSPVKVEPQTTPQITSFNSRPSPMEPASNFLNQILFGPPGTGKTFNSINKALEIIGEKVANKTRKELKDLFDEKVKAGQIVFTTFHQSMSYEDFIEGIKPIEPKQEGGPINYKLIDGVFKTIAKKAKENKELTSLNEFPTERIPFDTAFDILNQKIEDALLEDPDMTPNEMKKGLVIQLESSFFSITGINGSSIRMMTKTGNERNTMTKPTLKLIFEDLDNIETYVSGGRKFYYRALVEEMYKWQSDIKNISKNVSLKNYVIIIDEINRGNVSQIFGELITLIEEDKRIGKDEALEVTLAYSKVAFGVPSNLYIIGTMNTADRSVEALDSALRRRFSFFEMPPKPELIATQGKLKSYNGIVNNIDLSSLLITLNKRIEKLLDKDHQIGHSYFMSVSSVLDLKHSFQYKIIPLLQEYFFGDIGKIGLILGKEFFEEMTNTQENIFANFDAYDASEFSTRSIFKIKDLNTLSDDGFVKAINSLLLNKN